MSVLSRPYLYVPVSLDQASGDPVDPQLLPVKFALVPAGQQPLLADWHDGDWVFWHDGAWRARLLVGPGGTIAPTGTRDAWLWIDNEPELLVEFVGRVQFT